MVSGYYFNRTPIINVKENRLLKLHRKSTTIIENICRDIELLCMCIIIVYFRLEKGLKSSYKAIKRIPNNSMDKII